MNNNELREGLAQAICKAFDTTAPLNSPDGQSVWYRNRTRYLAEADAALAYIRQHDGHAEFVRAVLTEASREVGPNDRDYRLDNIVETCDAELAKEQNNG